MAALKKSSSFIGTASIYTVGNLIQKLSIFLLTPFYVKYLPIAEYGLLSVLLALIAVLTLFFDLGVNSAFIRWYFDKDEKNQVVKNSTVLRFLILIITSIIYITCIGYVEYLDSFRILGVIVFLDTIVNFRSTVLQAQNRSKEYAITRILHTAFQVAGAVVFVLYFEKNSESVINGLTVGSTFVGIPIAIMSVFSIKFKSIDWSLIRGIFFFGLPIFPHLLTIWIRNASDRLILAEYISEVEIGIYSFAYTIGLVAGLLVNSLDLAFAPFYYKLRNENIDKAIKFVSIYYNLLMLMLFLTLSGIFLFLDDIIRLAFDPIYLDSVNIFPIIAISYFFHGQYTIFIKPLYFHKRTKLVAILTVSVSALNLAVNFWLIPQYGIYAATWSTFGTFFLTFLLIYIFSVTIEKAAIPVKKLLLINGIIILILTLITSVDLTSLLPNVYIKAVLFGVFLIGSVKWGLLNWGYKLNNLLKA